jgi:hypothetical protein
VHSRKERRFRCATCGQTFAATTGTPFSRLHHAADLLVVVLTLLSHGCPLQAVVAAFDLAERTVARWQARGGQHCQRVHEHLVQGGGVELGHVQADELWVKIVGGRVWHPEGTRLALAVPSRLWLGGVVSVRRDGELITRLVRIVRRCARSSASLVCVDGLSSYVSAFLRAFRHPIRTGRRGRPRPAIEPGLLLAQVIKQYAQRQVVGVRRRVVRGTPDAVAAALAATGGGMVVNTAYIERLNATFRSCLAPLIRRGRALAHRQGVLTAGMYLVGCAYNPCWPHRSLRLATPGATGKWVERTPAMAAGLTDHPWTMADLLRYQVPLAPWVVPKRRGRPPRAAQPAAA